MASGSLGHYQHQDFHFFESIIPCFWNIISANCCFTVKHSAMILTMFLVFLFHILNPLGISFSHYSLCQKVSGTTNIRSANTSPCVTPDKFIFKFNFFISCWILTGVCPAGITLEDSAPVESQLSYRDIPADGLLSYPWHPVGPALTRLHCSLSVRVSPGCQTESGCLFGRATDTDRLGAQGTPASTSTL